MAQHGRRVRPAVGMAAVGLGIGAGAFGLDPGTAAEPPRPVAAAKGAPASAAGLLAEGRELVRQNRLGEALAKADAAAKLGGPVPAGADTPDALRRDVIADGRKQIDDLNQQAKTLAARGDASRSRASLDLARQIAAEIGLPTAPATTQAAAPAPDSPAVVQAVVFHPADPTPAVLPPALPALPIPPTPPADAKAPVAPSTVPVLPPPVEIAPPPRPVTATPVSREPEKPLLPAGPPLSLNPSGPSLPPVVPEAGPPTPPAPGETPVTLPKLATAAVGAALAATAPTPAQEPKPGPGTGEVSKATPAPPAAVTKEQLDTVKADVESLKDYKKQVQDLLQGKADGTGTSVLDAGVLKRLTDLEAKLDRIEKAVEAMRQGVAKLGDSRASQSPPANPIIAPMPATKTAVRIVNDYPSELSLILNGSSHRLKPGETKTVDVTPGSFTYELIAEGARPITRTIRDDETVTLRIK